MVILCFERRFSKQNKVIRLKSNIFPPKKFLGWLRHWCPDVGAACVDAGQTIYLFGFISGRSERCSHTFSTICFKMSWKLFQNGYFLGCVPTPFLLALHPWHKVTRKRALMTRAVLFLLIHEVEIYPNCRTRCSWTLADVVAQRLPAVFSQPRSVTFNESRMKQSLDKRKTHFCIGPMLKNYAWKQSFK